MKPIIINESSNFVVITYWWGRGNLNKNTQRPCPEDDNAASLSLQPIKYEEMIRDWETKCKKANCNYMAVEYPQFAKKGGYQIAINYKPKFILQALKACYPRGVLYIDGDMKIQKYPAIFDMVDIDYMARGWNIDSRESEDSYCYYPFVFETSGGTMYFNNTYWAKLLLKGWAETVKKMPTKADDRLISQYINKYQLLLQLKTIQLPIEYLWLSLDYDVNVHHSPLDLYITHPECLTSEDRAHQQGGHSNRHPPLYDYYITNRVKCSLKRMPFYEYIFFDSQKFVKTMQPYLDFLNKTKLIELIKFTKKYGDRNKIYSENLRIIPKLEIKNYKNTTVYITTKLKLNKRNVHYLKNTSNIVPLCLAYMKNGNNVVFVPAKATSINISKTIKLSRKNLEFICGNNSTSTHKYKKGYTLKISMNNCIFFKSESRVLRHLLNSSKNLSDLTKNYNSSFIFPSLIRCKWINI